jgi:CO/xanthine dehydrogenase Mo-binding subunit
VDLVLDPTGKFHLTTGIVEIGQGSHTVLMQMAAETLNCGPEFFKVDSADTMLHPDSGTTAASRVTYAVGLAAVDAATHMKETLKTLASRKWETVVDKVELVDGVLTNQLTGETLTLEQIASLSDGSLIVRSRLRVPFSETEADGGLAHPHVLYSSNVQIAQVAVDTETGQVNVEKVVTFPEAGRVINPLGLEGQCEGGIVQGIGYALMEKVHTRDGMVQNDHFGVYPIPTSMDIPYVEVVPVEVPEASGPYGAKGAGENATIPTAPAILNAITDAVNIHVSVLPVTPENLLDSLNTF